MSNYLRLNWCVLQYHDTVFDFLVIRAGGFLLRRSAGLYHGSHVALAVTVVRYNAFGTFRTCLSYQPPNCILVANDWQPIRSFALVPALFTAIAQAVHPVEVRGQDFVDTVTNKRLMIVGVDYQPGGQASYKPSEGKDVLSDANVCLRDAVLMQRLGVSQCAAMVLRGGPRLFLKNIC